MGIAEILDADPFIRRSAQAAVVVVAALAALIPILFYWFQQFDYVPIWFENVLDQFLTSTTFTVSDFVVMVAAAAPIVLGRVCYVPNTKQLNRLGQVTLGMAIIGLFFSFLANNVLGPFANLEMEDGAAGPFGVSGVYVNAIDIVSYCLGAQIFYIGYFLGLNRVETGATNGGGAQNG